MPDIKFIPFQPGHLQRLELQQAQANVRELMNGSDGFGLMGPYSWTALIAGKVIGCGGIIKQWPGRGCAWALVGHVPRPEWVAATNHVRRVLGQALEKDFHRLEISVAEQFAQGHRWAEALGFKVEALAKAYDPWKNNCVLYRRLRPCLD